MTQSDGDNETTVRIWGYGTATTSIDIDRWDDMTRKERREWAQTQYNKNVSPTEITIVETDHGDEEEW